MAHMQDISRVAYALSLLTPSEMVDLDKTRIGNLHADGGYVLANRFREGQKVYSYGLSNELTFDLSLARQGLQIFMYDHTIERIPYGHENFHYFKQGISAENQPAKLLFSLKHHIAVNGHDHERDMILKMDVEGAEWTVFDEIDIETLKQFEQITLEMHELEKIRELEVREKFIRVFEKLTSVFKVIHVHANNAAPLDDVLGFVVPPLLEVTFVRKNICDFAPWQTVIPMQLDRPNVAKHDHVLAFYPFLPTALPSAQVHEAIMNAVAHSNYLIDWKSKSSRHMDTRGTNIATSGKCTQSSLSAWSSNPNEADNAVTRQPNGGFAFHTAHERSPWWMIDFGQPTVFDEVIVYNRLETASARAHSLVMEVSDGATLWHVVYENEYPFGGIDGDALRIRCPGMTANFIRLRLREPAELHLDAVQIYRW